MAYIGNTPLLQQFTTDVDYFNGNDSDTTFQLSRDVASVNEIEVTINNVQQKPLDAYTVSGSTLTISSAPSTGTNNVYVRYLAPNATVVTPQLSKMDFPFFKSDGTRSGVPLKSYTILPFYNYSGSSKDIALTSS